MGIKRVDLPVHWKHFLDGFPLCWASDEIGTFEGTRKEAEVTCEDCLTYLKEK